jgi:hypothetical protein
MAKHLISCVDMARQKKWLFPSASGHVRPIRTTNRSPACTCTQLSQHPHTLMHPRYLAWMVYLWV